MLAIGARVAARLISQSTERVLADLEAQTGFAERTRALPPVTGLAQ
jgi:hypothetical protein